MPFKYEDLRARIVANTVLANDPEAFYKGTPCWWWIGARNASGYGKMSVRLKLKKKGEKHRRVKSRLAHRVSIEVFSGKRLHGRYGLHLCPPHPNRKLCCNPWHLRGGTATQNNRQTVAEGRHKQPN